MINIDEPKFQFDIHCVDEYGNEYETKNKVKIFHNQGEDERDVIARVINNFMRQLSWSSFDKDMILLKSITVDEADYLLDCLDDYRADQKNNNQT